MLYLSTLFRHFHFTWVFQFYALYFYSSSVQEEILYFFILFWQLSLLGTLQIKILPTKHIEFIKYNALLSVTIV